MTAQPVIQASFNSGEWAPALYARVDMAKYHSAAALLRNFFVDYRGGASTRPGTKYCLQAFKSATAVRLIPFQASFSVGYMLEFGDLYIRFYNNGAPVLETGINITGATQANPCVVSVANTYAVGDWVYISGVVGMTQLNGKYYRISARSAGTITLEDLRGNAINSTGYGAWSSGGTTKRVYTVTSPYAAADLAEIKYAQNVSTLILCHADYAPYSLTITSATNWTLAPIAFGTTIGTPTGVTVTTTLAGGSTNYSYIVTAVDENGQESAVSTATALANKADLRTVAGTNKVTWSPVTGAASYNVYKSDVSVTDPVPAGVPYGFIGNVTGLSIADSNITADFSQGPPVARNPFASGAAVSAVTVTVAGSYTTRPTLTFSAPPVGTTATGSVVMTGITAAIAVAGTGYAPGDTLTFISSMVVTVDTVGGAGDITGVTLTTGGSFTGALPALPLAPISTSGAGVNATFNFTWGVTSVTITAAGTGYFAAPSITFSAGAAAATATIGPTNAGNPSVPAFFQQRLVLAAPTNAPQTLYFSQPGAFYNFDVSSPVQDSDSITASLVSGQLNNIKSMIPQTAGLIVLSDGASWLLNGGQSASAVTPATIVANAQSFIGTNDIPPIVSNYDVLYVQAKGSSIRDSSYNFYANVFTGTDISIQSSHLFFGYEILDWCWAEEPFKVVWAIRNDGTLLSLTFLKEQEFVGWAHSDSEDGAALFKSCASIVESIVHGYANAVYVVVQRTVGASTVQYIERMEERDFPGGVVDAWCVDSGLQYDGTPATSFTGGEHLAGKTCTGLADGVIIPDFTMPTNGSFTLGTAASLVTVGLPYTCQLKTLAIDTGDPTIQSKVKKIPGVTVRVADTLGLEIGPDFNHLVAMKDLVRGNVSGMLTGQETQVVSDLVTGDAYTTLAPTYTVPGQYCIQQSNPYPATILGVIPDLTVGDTKSERAG